MVAIVPFLWIDYDDPHGKRQAAVFDLRQVRRGTMPDPQVYGDDIIVVEQSGSKTAMRRFIESMPVLGIFSWL